GDAPVALQDVNIEEPKRRQPHNYGVRTVLQLGEEHRLVLANVLWAELIGRAPEVPAEVRHTVHVRTNGRSGEVTPLQLLKHKLTQLVHRESSFSANQTTPATAKAGSAARGSVRRRSGFVQVGLSSLVKPSAIELGTTIMCAGLSPIVRTVKKSLFRAEPQLLYAGVGEKG